MKDVTQLIWATYIFGNNKDNRKHHHTYQRTLVVGIYGDIVEGDIDDDVNSKTGKKSSGDTNPLPSDPSSFAAWTKVSIIIMIIIIISLSPLLGYDLCSYVICSHC
ncbi:hypothetical protein FOZ62_021074 [Perkinsus olseni]|uniref:Uncharacterized protein n=1 Tax=Perkinsus olseni TaxID=32597 RepID=A0A7J6RNV6_PEROL|nr:hypothetical protein FOZ62_021074 [Perkinsus olseni]